MLFCRLQREVQSQKLCVLWQGTVRFLLFVIILQSSINYKEKCFSFLLHKLQIETCKKVKNALKRFDRRGTPIQILPFHDALTKESQLANMEEFACRSSNEVCQFLVCIDRYNICITHLSWSVRNVLLRSYDQEKPEKKGKKTKESLLYYLVLFVVMKWNFCDLLQRITRNWLC